MLYVYNSTGETVKICLFDTTNNETNTILTGGETWKHNTKDGWNTVVIIPLNANQNTFSYTIQSGLGLIIERKLEKLILVPSAENSPESKADTTIAGHECVITSGSAELGPGPCESTGCVIFNETNEVILACITDCNNRNSHVLLNHGEHHVIEARLHRSAFKQFFASAESCFRTVRVSVLNMESYIRDGNSVALAKYTLTGPLHETGSTLTSDKSYFNFVRAIKKDGYFTMEQDLSYQDYGIPYSYLLSKECCQKIRTFYRSDEVPRIGDHRYEIVEQSYNRYDVVAGKNECSIL